MLAKLKVTERQHKEAEAKAYEDPDLSNQARDEGNKLFKSGDFAGSVKLYTEAIKRNPKDARGYTNRATAYTKLLALAEALKDAETAIKVYVLRLLSRFTDPVRRADEICSRLRMFREPDNPKGYIRKGAVLIGMKKYDEAISALEQASEKDVSKKNSAEIQREQRRAVSAKFEERSGETDEQTMQRAMKDPEVAAILQDPVMQQILQQAQQDPQSMMSHLQNPMIREKIMKLQQSGILKMR